MFERPHHQRIARLLESLDASTLEKHQCMFGGGTAMALRFGEYRESRDVDFLVSSVAGYREVRGLVTRHGIASLFGKPPKALREVRMDQYGIRTMLDVEGEPIRFEIILEGRIELEAPGPNDVICGVRCLTLVDMTAEKLLANSDRWADASMHNRDLIDLAMMPGEGKIPASAMAKALQAYSSVEADLQKAQAHVSRDGRLSACMEAMQMTQPPALVMDRILKLRVAPTRAKPRKL